MKGLSPEGGIALDDIDILGLFFTRREAALHETQRQYGAYLRSIALNITGDERDADECVNDTLLQLWRNCMSRT